MLRGLLGCVVYIIIECETLQNFISSSYKFIKLADLKVFF